MRLRDKYTKKQIYMQIRNLVLVTLGCAVLAFGASAFIVPTNLLTGGIATIAIIIQHVVDVYTDSGFQVADIVTAIFEIGLFFVGLAFLGKKFSAHTLYASIVYPAFFALFYRTNALKYITDTLTTNFNEPFLGLFLCAIFGGLCVGAGVAITMIGDGSTGGVDIIALVVGKYLHIKESVTTFIVDAVLIVAGIISLRDLPNIVPLGLIGVISAFVAAIMVQVLFGSMNANCIVEVLTYEDQKVSDYIQDVLGRGCTIVYGEGGYSHEQKRIVKVALSHKQAQDLKAYIAEADPKAFMMVTTSAEINGEGFLPFLTPRTAMLKRFLSEKPDNGRSKRIQGEDTK
ncbi:MAG: YitT family protein [Bacilli bacterium]|nr:YitT family protein [Bacilli bacterium]